MKKIVIRAGKERSLQRRHPWVFEGSVQRGSADSGETVRVESAEGQFLCWGAYSPQSIFRVRAWSFDEAQRIDAGFFAQRIEAALAVRAARQTPKKAAEHTSEEERGCVRPHHSGGAPCGRPG